MDGVAPSNDQYGQIELPQAAAEKKDKFEAESQRIKQATEKLKRKGEEIFGKK